MQQYSIHSYKTKKVLFEGYYPSFSACLEAAVSLQTDLSFSDLRNTNINHGSFDGASMQNADFSGANLTGANLSEADLSGSIFNHTDLYNTCLCYTNLTACDFTNGNFGGTDINGADISKSKFSTLSCLDLDFITTDNMNGCIFINTENEICPMSQHPIIIKGIFSTPIIIFDTMIKIGNSLFQKEILPFLIRTLEIHQPSFPYPIPKS